MAVKQKQQPGMGEVVLATLLSVVLGVTVALAYLILTPVEVVREPPEEPERHRVYFIEGGRLAARGNQWHFKKQAFVSGRPGEIALTEEELNLWISTGMSTPQSGGDPIGLFAPGTPNFRINDGVLQVGVPGSINAVGLNLNVLVQARGGFEKGPDGFYFSPQEFYVGSCPLGRIGLLSGMISDQIYRGLQIPEDVATAWGRVSDVSVQDNLLVLTLH